VRNILTADESTIFILIGIAVFGVGLFFICYIAYIRIKGFRAFAQVISLNKFPRYSEGTVRFIYKPMLEIIGEPENWKSEWFSGAQILSDPLINFSTYDKDEVLEIY